MDNVSDEITTRLIPKLTEAAKTGHVLDLQDVLERFAFDNICKLAFNVDPSSLAGGRGNSGDGDELIRAFDTANLLSLERFMYINPKIWKLKRKLNLGSEKQLRESIEVVHRFADDIIRRRLEGGDPGSKDEDLLSRFIGIDEMNSPESLRNNVINFMLAGRDTTSAALSWFFWLLSSHPDVEQKILRELESIRARTGKSIGETYSFEDLKEMNYLHASMTEALRLYPPVPMDSKTCLEDDVLPDGTFVGKGWFVTYEAYAMGRMESLWGKDCERYYPERWIEGGVFKPETPFKFPVFHAGPRICMGKDMAYIQMKSIAATVLERFWIDVVNQKNDPKYLLSITLRIKGGLHVNVRERNE